MTAQDLKNSILQLAAQGKLVPQDPADEPASELLKRIQAEKSKLAKEGKHKKGKSIQPISEDEVPFDIPESWAWVRLGECSSYAQKKEKPYKNTIAPDTWSLDLEDIEKGTGRIVQKCLFRDRNISGERVMFQKGQILYSKLRPYLKKVLVAPTDGICSSEIVPFSVYAGINAQYMAYVLTTPHIDFVINSVTYGTKMPRVGTDTMTNLLIPLPPLAEQARIVAKIEELLPYIEEYDAAEKRLSALNKKFPDQLRKSILQQAIMGKLTERDPADEPASELLKRIRAEKSRLVRGGKLKREKPLPPITEDDIPFEIPEGWEWVKIGDIAVIQSSKRVFEKDYVSEGVPFFRSKEIGDLQRGEAIKTELFISEQHYQAIRENFGVPKEGDILITSVGTIGNTWICDGREFYYKDGNIIQICGSQFFNSRYIELVIHSPLFLERALSTVAGTAYTALTIIKLKNLVVPLPPLAEQQRIVERVEELLAVCRQLNR